MIEVDRLTKSYRRRGARFEGRRPRRHFRCVPGEVTPARPTAPADLDAAHDRDDPEPTSGTVRVQGTTSSRSARVGAGSASSRNTRRTDG